MSIPINGNEIIDEGSKPAGSSNIISALMSSSRFLFVKSLFSYRLFYT